MTSLNVVAAAEVASGNRKAFRREIRRSLNVMATSARLLDSETLLDQRCLHLQAIRESILDITAIIDADKQAHIEALQVYLWSSPPPPEPVILVTPDEPPDTVAA